MAICKKCYWEEKGMFSGQGFTDFILTVSHMPEEKPHATEKEARDGERIKQMLQFVQAHYAEDLTLAQSIISRLQENP